MSAAAAAHGRQDGRSSGARGAHLLAVGLAAMLVASALPAVASAADYCVFPNQSCDGPHNVMKFEDALAGAELSADADRIILGADRYTAPGSGGFSYYQAGGPLEIVGAGVGQTILTSPAGGEFVVGVFGGAGTSVHDLTIELPQNAADGSTGLMTNNAARRIEVIEDPTQSYTRSGVQLQHSATLEDSGVTLDSTQDTRAVGLGTGGGTVRRSVLSARTGVTSVYGGTIERSRLTASDAGVLAYRNGTAITTSLIRVTAAGGAGIAAVTRSGAYTTVNADRVTIIGPNLPFTTGAFVGNEPAPAESAEVNLTNSIIRGVSAPLWVTIGAPGRGKISASYSDYDPSGNVSTGGANATISETNTSNVGDARFADPPRGDYHLLPGSPLIDTGDPGTAQGLDLDGNTLVADGNGDGGARGDLGAFEFQPAPVGSAGQPGGTAPVDRQAPLISGFRVTPSVFAVARARTLAAKLPRGTRFRYMLSEAAQVKVTIQRRLAGRRARYRTAGTLRRAAVKGSNRIRFSGRIGKRALRPSRYRAVITATDAAGNRSTLRRARFRVAAS